MLPTSASESSSLLPTPSATQNDGHDPEKFLARRDRERAKGRNGNGFGLTLGMAAALLPTPTGDDANNVTRESGTYQSLARTTHSLLPTPSASDAKGGRTTEGHAPMLPVATRLLPTPMANQENPGAGGELRAALTHGPDRRNTTGTDSWGRPNRGRLLPTPQAADGDGGRIERTAMRNGGKRPSGSKATLTLTTAVELSGELTSRPFATGSPSPDQPHDQLTLEDA